MVLDFEETLENSEQRIKVVGDNAEFLVFDVGNPCLPQEMDVRYSKAMWTIVELINSKYQDKLEKEFNLYNWIEHNNSDELSYFLNEASSNALNYSEFKAVWKFVLYFGEKGFIVGVMQQGNGFNPKIVFEKKIRSNEGAGFTFYEECSNRVFFDSNKKARAVYFEYLFK